MPTRLQLQYSFVYRRTIPPIVFNQRMIPSLFSGKVEDIGAFIPQQNKLTPISGRAGGKIDPASFIIEQFKPLVIFFHNKSGMQMSDYLVQLY
jgi:hypothetical protein